MKRLIFILSCFLYSAASVSCDKFEPKPIDSGEPTAIINLPFQTSLFSQERFSIIGSLGSDMAVGYSEAYLLTFKQPIDHTAPEKGSFEQGLVVCFKGFDKPVVINTSGYFLQGLVTNLAVDLDANYVEVEHRCFGDSVYPGYENWEYHDTKQAASDFFELVSVLKKLFSGKFVATGSSKGGVEATLLSYYFPGVVDLTVPFCAPFCTSQTDTRISDHLYYAEDSRDLRDKYIALERVAFENADEFSEKFAVDLDLPADTPKSVLRNAFINYVMEGQFTKFSIGSPAGWDKNFPDPDDLSAVYKYLVTDSYSISPVLPPYKDALKGPYPYLVQASRDLGYYKYGAEPFKPFVDNITFGLETSLYARDAHALSEYDGGALMKTIVEDFLPNDSEYPFVFVYGGRDPWTGASVDPNKLGPAVKMIVEPNGYHSDSYLSFTTKTEIQKAIRSALGE